MINPFSGTLAGGELELRSGERTEADGLVLALDGAICNIAELGEELGVWPDQGLVLSRGYRRWGAALAPRLRGEFALLVWDPRDGRGLLVPDQLGVRRVALRRVGGRLWFATEIR